MILILLDFLRDLALLIINTITKIISSASSVHQQSGNGLEPENINHLQETRSALLRQQDEVSCQLEVIETTIQRLTYSASQDKQDLNQLTTSTPSSVILETVQSTQSNITPLRQRRRRTLRQTNIGEPYPLPFSSPRTPEEVRHNNIVIWLNEIRSQHQNNHGNPE
jgi:hypothetical protein